MLCDICSIVSFRKEGQFYKVREICYRGHGRRKSGLDLAVYVNRCTWGDISLPVGESGVFLGLDTVCVYHTDVNWELPGVGEESSLLGRRRWDRLAVPGKETEVYVGESPGAMLTEAGN